MWFQILSELFVNIAAAWFVVAFVDLQVVTLTFNGILPLTLKFALGMFSLVLAKFLREKRDK